MKAKPIKNLAASLRAKLLDRSRARQEEFQFVLDRWVAERFLYRLSKSKFRDAFVLKGATLFLLWQDNPPRPTRDLDLLGYGPSDLSSVQVAITSICEIHSDDGLVFDPSSIGAHRIREDQAYEGVRVTVPASLDGARVTLQIDIGFGDAVEPAPLDLDFPVMLPLPVPNLRTYPPEAVIAEKLEAMTKLGMANTRMKDFFDIWLLAQTRDFDTPTLALSIAATFERRKTPIPVTLPTALTDEFLRDSLKQSQWKAFLTRLALKDAPEQLFEVGRVIALFLAPVIQQAHAIARRP